MFSSRLGNVGNKGVSRIYWKKRHPILNICYVGGSSGWMNVEDV